MTRTDDKAGRRDELAHFYVRCHRGLFWAVRRNTAETDDDLIHEACAVAWLALVRRSDVTLDRRGYAWLVITATYEARHICREARDTQKVDPERDWVAQIDESRDPCAFDHDPLEHALDAELHAERCVRFSALKPRERRDMLLKAAGFNYAEIATATTSSRTAVNRHLAEGRARLRGEL